MNILTEIELGIYTNSYFVTYQINGVLTSMENLMKMLVLTLELLLLSVNVLLKGMIIHINLKF